MADDENDLAEVKPVTGRPNDIPIQEPQGAPLGGNSTFADRAKARSGESKAVASTAAENKAVASDDTAAKSPRSRRSSK